jgi:acetyl-CoA C-acetyltransferase
MEGDSGTPVTESIGFAPRPVTRVSAYCASGMEAVRGGALAIAAGEYDVVLVVGAEKMRDVTPRGSLVARTGNLTHPTIGKGRSGPGFFALLASRYLSEYDRTPDDMAAVAVKNHEHATRNPIAQYSTPVTKEQVRSSPMIADPLRLLDCTPTTDGAAAIVLTSTAWAREREVPTTRGSTTPRTTSSASAPRVRRRVSPTSKRGCRHPARISISWSATTASQSRRS